MGVGADGLSVIWVWNTASGASELGVTDLGSRAASSGRFPGDQREVQQTFLQELESTANPEDFAPSQQGHSTRNMLSSRVPVPTAWKYARSEVTKQGFSMARTTNTCKNSRFCLGRVRSNASKHHENPGLVNLQQEIEFADVCIISYTSTEKPNPDSRSFWR